MFRRASAVAAVLVAVAFVACGCAGTPAPVETTADALTEEEAFAAAEETYRAYVDALNQVDLSDPETFEPVYDFTTGPANANERETLSQMHADGWTKEGATVVDAFQPIELTADNGVLAEVCSNVSEVSVVDSVGMSQVSPQRPERYSVQVRLPLSAG